MRCINLPRLIYCGISGFGADGPLGGLPGYDAVLQAMGGVMSINGTPESGATRVGIPIVDYVTGYNALVGILLILCVDFKSLRLTLLVAATIPFALIGGVAATFLHGGSVSLGSLIGFVTVLGIAARNGIMLVSHYRHLRDVEGEPFGLPLVIRGARERLTPILMTALTTGLALLPLAITGNKPGQEIEYPLAIVILGGLVTSTILNLFLLPPLYLLFGDDS